MVHIDTHNWDMVNQESATWLPKAHQEILWEEYQIRPGIKLIVQELPAMNKAVGFRFATKAAPVEFMYCLSGYTELTVQHRAKRSLQVSTIGGDFTVSYLPESTGTSTTKSGIPLRAAGVQIHPETLCNLAEESGQSVYPQLYEQIKSENVAPFFEAAPLPLPLQITVQQIVECPLKGAMRKMFLEYKALELLYTQLSLLDSAVLKTKAIADFEIQAAMKAHTILMQDIISPPSLTALARQVGLTHARLNRIFKALFNTTVFGLLRQARLDCARRLLEDGRKNVAEIAYECGFSSPSHLSYAFGRRFGLQPKQYQIEHIRQIASPKEQREKLSSDLKEA